MGGVVASSKRGEVRVVRGQRGGISPGKPGRKWPGKVGGSSERKLKGGREGGGRQTDRWC